MGRVKNNETCCRDKRFIENSIEPYRVRDPAKWEGETYCTH